MTNTIRRFIQLATDVLPEHPGTHRSKHVAIVYEGNTVRSIGFNQAKTHPLQAKYGANHHKIHLHAEIDAIVKANRRRIDLSRCGIVVVRFKHGELCESRPCDGCWSAIQAYNFRNVAWSTVTGDIDML